MSDDDLAEHDDDPTPRRRITPGSTRRLLNPDNNAIDQGDGWPPGWVHTASGWVELPPAADDGPVSKAATDSPVSAAATQPDALMSAAALADKIGRPVKTVRTFLTRLARERDDVRIKAQTDPRRGEPTFLYRLAVVLPELKRHFDA